ncbi:hypothetical protein BsWGS_07337 [Bradybaena similaris]
MGIWKILLALKGSNVKAENLTEQQADSPSPAVSSISSFGSGTLLVHGPQPKVVPKKKHVSWAVGRKHASNRLTNFIWSCLFLLVIAATVIVVAALAENIRRTLWSKEVTYTDGDSELRSNSNSLEDVHSKIKSDVKEETCVHRRIVWEHGSQNSEIIHDIKAKWSAIVDHDEERCLIFDLRHLQHTDCPRAYPWEMDVHVGVPSCRGPLALIAPIRKIMHHICSEQQVNLTLAGDLISEQCSNHRILQVDKVTIQYFDRHFRRVARRSIANEERPENMITPSFASDAAESMEHSPVATDVFNSENKRPHSSALPPKETIKPWIQAFTNGKQSTSSSNLAAKDEFTPSSLLSKILEKKTTTATNISAKKRPRDVKAIVVKTLAQSKLIGALVNNTTKLIGDLVNNAKKEVSESSPFENNGSLSTKTDYWEVMYNYIDDAGNVFRADQFKEITLRRK